MSELNNKICGNIEAWCNRSIENKRTFVYCVLGDGVVRKRSWVVEVRKRVVAGGNWRNDNERCHHRLSQCRVPLSPNQMSEKL